MKFYYENNSGDDGIFSENNIVKAIYTAWNIEANLYIVNDKCERLTYDSLRQEIKLIFAPWESNECNSGLLKEYGYYMEDGVKGRNIREVKTGKVIKYDWSEVKQLV